MLSDTVCRGSFNRKRLKLSVLPWSSFARYTPTRLNDSLREVITTEAIVLRSTFRRGAFRIVYGTRHAR